MRTLRAGGAAACLRKSEGAPANSSTAPATFHGYGRTAENNGTAWVPPGKAIENFMKFPAAERLGGAMGPMERNF
ncbi:MAG: hypothetical protein LBI69_03145 [Puniceicoccales bacterium]|nr:hypothetical protein [Puniceicoccales bacterium]